MPSGPEVGTTAAALFAALQIRAVLESESKQSLGTAQPQGSIHVQGDARFEHIAQRLKEWQPEAIVIGVPYHPDGAAHENTARAKKFGRQLHGRFGLPVFEVDERYSTTEALASGARDADAASACIILEQFLRSLV